MRPSASGTPGALPATTLRDRGYKGKIYFTDGIINQDFLRVGGKAVNGAFLPAGPFVVANQLPDSNPIKKVSLEFIKRYDAAYPKSPANSFSAHAWNVYLLLKNAIPVALKTAKPGTEAFRSALRDALQRGASDEEIQRLTQNLREKLDKFMQALTEQLKRQDQASDLPLDRNTRVVRPQDLKNMLDRIENLAKSGARDAARRMLDEMQAMLDSLSRNRQARSNPEGQGNDPLDDLGRMIQEQQQLRDKTYRQGRQDGQDDQERTFRPDRHDPA